MASRVLSPPSRPNILHLPTGLRVLLHQKAVYTRPFSITTPRRDSEASLTSAEAITPSLPGLTQETSNYALEVATAIPLGFLDIIHSTGLPWWAALPTSAVLVRSVFVYYCITKKLRRHAQIQSNLVPLVSARALVMSRAPEYRARLEEWSPGLRGIGSLWEKFKCTERSAMALGKQFGAPRPYQTWRPYANFGVLVAMMEAIRMKCGARQGFLSLLMSPFQWYGENVVRSPPDQSSDSVSGPSATSALHAINPDLASTIIDTSTSSNAEGYSSEVIAAARESTSDPAVLTALSRLDGVSPVSHIAPSHAQYMDPTLQTEGFLWISNLAAVDSSHYLSVIAACILFFQIAVPPYRRRIEPLPMHQFKAEPATLKLVPAVQLWFDKLPTSQQQTILDKLEAAPALRKRVEEVPAVLQKHTLDGMTHSLLPSALEYFFTSTRSGVAFIIAVLFHVFVAVNMPAGMLLYFMTSLSTGWLQARWLDYRVPVAPAILPCRRSLRFRVRAKMGFTL